MVAWWFHCVIILNWCILSKILDSYFSDASLQKSLLAKTSIYFWISFSKYKYIKEIASIHLIYYCLHLADYGANMLIGLTLFLLRFLGHTSKQNLKLSLEKEWASWSVWHYYLSFPLWSAQILFLKLTFCRVAY